ncbi:cytochrome c [Burkholderia pseudomultivorans]|uniref:Gluconate 2-dehydrogenase cytochrome c subunit n=1 Tax=Burkholderia pseudomultivorans TaxID=1207504 RepID=A0ABU2EED1_9BURK|nr:cytochrome c [Burkholderia pseudomultivorans]MDR8731721.1 Gluconate 2-dehydrogenase cytochrome c subunit [Burkholderia pseudomultivorans]MDR8739058.1 Gluconate 2-dehydrogenase cytochrome c subunit [Burkholderia pseudomultivorans]MDR8745630.1 Gluconate 2-dehydrogenase cytochrome c subunit [Burkholderia pseudomultivorans]MDR8757924.1 Gluconate 2-dehydrogenase cytochrome c subunit [Burkholderia pseudomultivorans]MDR8781961.1 Gluconate 2-dehydrogenase cytochrome c subunit [Burkholderia pseudomu
MKTTLRFRNVIAGLIAVAVIVVACAWIVAAAFGGRGGDEALGRSAPIGATDTALIQRGAYLATLGDCAACHVAKDGKPFAGGLPIATPIGTVYTTNITPDVETGIGRYTLGDFERAVRRGIRADGSSMYPAMPYPSYAHVSDDDVRALYAYFMHGVTPVDAPDRKPDIPWPLSLRWPLTYWRWMFAPKVQPAVQTNIGGATDAGAAHDAALLARGRYLVEGLMHCGSCHTPRGIGLQEKALGDADGPDYLAGSVIDHYVANNLRGDDLTGLGQWSKADIVEFLRTGRNAQTAAFGGMRDVVEHSSQYLNDTDLLAVATYLKSLPANGATAHYTYAAAAGAALAKGDVSARGAIDYLNSCSACHLSSGKGYRDTFPALAGNAVVNAKDPTSLINIVLNGNTEVGTSRVPTQFTMPPFGDRLTDVEVADVVTFIRSSWGNRAPPVEASEVAKVRAQTHAPAVARRQ